MSERASSGHNPTHGNSPGRDVRRLPGGAAAPSGGAGAKTIALREIELSKERDLVLGRALAQIERERTYGIDGASSAAHWGVLHGLDHGRASELLRLGRLLHVKPETEQDVRDGTFTTQHAAVLGGLVEPTPALPPKHAPDPAKEAARVAAERERLLKFAGLAKEKSRRELSRAVNQEKESVKQRERVTTLVFHVKQAAKDDWRFARKLASRKAQRPLTDGEAFSLVVADFVKLYDNDDVTGQKSVRERRAGPTSENPNARTIPAEVRREVKQRAGDHCEFPGCPNGMFLQICHLRSHADRGDREPANLVLLCSQHHTMMDLGTLRFFERTEAGVAFVDVRTGEIFEASPTRHAADVLPNSASGLEGAQSSLGVVDANHGSTAEGAAASHATPKSVPTSIDALKTSSAHASKAASPPTTPEHWYDGDAGESSEAGNVSECVPKWISEPISPALAERCGAHAPTCARSSMSAESAESAESADRRFEGARQPMPAGTVFT